MSRLNKIKNIIREEIKRQNLKKRLHENQSRHPKHMLLEKDHCHCCGRIKAGLAAQECMDGGGTATGTACSGGGYTSTCAYMSVGPGCIGLACAWVSGQITSYFDKGDFIDYSGPSSDAGVGGPVGPPQGPGKFLGK
jgi:hypothetical protein